MLQAQDFYLPVNAAALMRMERAGLTRQPAVHAGFKPMLAASGDFSNVPGIGADTTPYYYKITEKIFSDHLVEFNRPNFKFYADFLFDFGYGREEVDTYREEKTLYTNTRGFSIGGEIGERVYFYSDFYENQSRLPSYLDVFVDSLDVIPGSGRVKEFKGDAYDFSMASAYVGVKAASWLDLHFGHFKQFVGHGHRSLLLSDNAFNYPFFSYMLNFFEGKLTYRYSLASLQNLERLPIGDTPESIFKRKVLATNYVSFKPNQNWELGLFQGAIHRTFSDSSGSTGFPWQALNPIPVISPGVEGFDNQNRNYVLGLNLAWRPMNLLKVYGQAMIDNPDETRFGYQVGARIQGWLEAIDFGLEYNEVRASSYSDPNRLQSYTHYNQPLAHPLGAGFKEWRLSAVYYKNRIYAHYQLIRAALDVDGRNPLADNPGAISYSAQSVFNQDLQVAYIFNPSQNFQIYAGYQDRTLQDAVKDQRNGFWYVGMRTQIANIYRDF